MTVFRSRGWDARLVAPPGAPRSEDRERGFWPSTARPPSRSASSLMMRPRSSDRPRPRVGGAPPRSRQGPRPRAPRPSPARSGAALTLVPARRSERAKCPKRRRSARAPCSTTPKAHRKHTGNTTKTPAHRLVSWRHPRHRGFNPLRFGHTQPNNPRQPTPPPRRPHRKQPTPRNPRISSSPSTAVLPRPPRSLPSPQGILLMTLHRASIATIDSKPPASLPYSSYPGRHHAGYQTIGP